MEVSNDVQNSQNVTKNLPSHSFIVTGQDKDIIHQENLERINEMTEEEILEERNKLMSTMDPAIVAYLKSKRHQMAKLVDRPPSTAEEQIKAAENITSASLSTVSQILSQPDADNWLNFNKMEITKLAWMKDIDMNTLKGKENYEARYKV